MVKKLYIIYGCHGAGKTTLAKNIMLSDGQLTEQKNHLGKYTLSENKKYVAVGQYHSKCGGADSIKTTDLYFEMIDFLFENYPNSIVICEGIFLSALFNKPLKQFLKYKYELGAEVTQIFLYSSIETSYNRVYKRNNRIPKMENIKNKQKSVTRTYKKFLDLNEFKNIVINTENKTALDVYKEAIGKINE